MQPDPAAAATCELCGRKIVTDRAEHYRGHPENARAYLELVEKARWRTVLVGNRPRVDPALRRCWPNPDQGR